MKTTGARLPFLLKMSGLGLLGVLVPAAGAAEPAAARAADQNKGADKTFTLFMGADIDVEQGKEARRVKNVVGDAFVVVIDQKPVEVEMNRGKIGMKVTPQLKLSDKSAVVKDLKFERAYTPENDPNKKWASSQSGSAAMANVGLDAGKMVNAQRGANIAEQNRANLFGGIPGGANLGAVGANGNVSQEGGFAVDAAVTSMSADYRRASQAVGSDQNSAGYQAQQLQEELDKKLFDAVRVTCEISSPKPVSDPYLVIITQYREKDDPPGAVKSWVFAKALDRLDENPVTVRLIKGGFPAGFELVKQQFHIYGGGRELGSNVADKNVALTRDEAHEYIVVDHLVTHKTETLAPSVALGVSHKDFFPHFASVQLQQEIFVRVDKAGRPAGAFRNEKCTEATGDAYLDSLVAQTRFKPALQSGKAVEGVAKLKIADLAI